MIQYEQRSLTSSLEAKDGKLVGYAAVFGKPSHDLGGVVEVIKPTAFNRTLKENKDVRALIDHKPEWVIGRTTAGTLKLSIDEVGLRAEIEPPNTTAAKDLLESIKRGDIDGMSFRFRVPTNAGQYIDYSTPTPTRYLLDVDLLEVSVVTFPAYPDASVALRSIQESKCNTLQRMRLRLSAN